MIAVLCAATLAATTRFTLVKDGGRDWLVTPGGQRTFSFGVCCVGHGQDFPDYDPAKPGYAGFRYYPSGAAWAKDAVERLQSWGFNTIGAWSDTDLLRKPAAPNLLFTPILHMGSAAGAPWKDMWDPEIVGLMDKIAKDQIVPLQKEKRIVGYFSDNEMGWWNAAMFEWSWKGKYSRVRLTDLLRRRYRGSWAALTRDFVPSEATSFAGLEKNGRIFLRPGGNGIEAVHAWMEVLAERYYFLCRSIIRKYDPGALYLGDRYISNFYPEVAKAAGKYVDVLSTNLNADWPDGTFARFYLPNLERLCGKPIMITEYYECARDTRSGNKNDSSGFPVVDTQVERAAAFLNQTRTLLETPYVVGAHWFQYYDEPKFGRDDGENYNMGLVDIDNRPYDEMTAASASLDLVGNHRRTAPAHGDVRMGVPALENGELKDLAKWPRNRAYVQPFGLDERADLYFGWTSGALYLTVYWNEDRFPEAYYKDGKIPASEHARLKLTLNGKSFNLDLETTPLAIKRTLDTRCWAILKLAPGAYRAGQAVSLDASLVTRSHAYRARWQGKYTLSS
ncbi:MAG TPA: hypothetical protein VG820_12515 [Fimbriimonadaceae bacterium]|nr:hypothetical protein [Fimbriimonadaceae bacterium]